MRAQENQPLIFWLLVAWTCRFSASPISGCPRACESRLLFGGMPNGNRQAGIDPERRALRYAFEVADAVDAAGSTVNAKVALRCRTKNGPSRYPSMAQLVTTVITGAIHYPAAPYHPPSTNSTHLRLPTARRPSTVTRFEASNSATMPRSWRASAIWPPYNRIAPDPLL